MAVYITDDRGLFNLVELTPGDSQIALFAWLTDLVHTGKLLFPAEVVKDVCHKADEETDARLIIWTQAVAKPAADRCKVPYNFRIDAQAWAQDSGYEEGLDPAIGGRESCITAVAGYIIQVMKHRVPCEAIAADFSVRPGRVPLGVFAKGIGCPTISPDEFLALRGTI